MCVALPGLIISLGEPSGTSVPAVVRFGTMDLDVNLVMVPDATVGDYVVVHAGFALNIVPAEEAERTLALMKSQESP